MGLFNGKSKNGGLMDEIRCDEPSYLIWKWHPYGSLPGESNKENAIRWGSSIRVKDGEMAVFVYNQSGGTTHDYIVGPRDDVLKTANLPVLSSIIGLAYDGGTPFQAEVYFINLAKIIQVKFAVPYFDIFDPRYQDFSVPVAVRGTISFQITNFAEFIQINRLQNFSLEDFQKQIRDAVNRYVKDIVANAPAQHDIPVIQLETKISQVNDEAEYIIRQRLEENFGVTVSAVDIGVIDVDKTSEGYSQLMAITKNIVTQTVQAEAQANVKNIHDKQRIEAENYEETLRMNREENQYAIHKETQMKNFAAYQVEAQTNVGVAGAEALGKMGQGGAGTVNMGDTGSGFNPMAMMAGMTLGGAIGQNIAGTMNGMMNVNTMQANQGVVTPPPIPTVLYHIAVNGKTEGPYDKIRIKQLINEGVIGSDSLVWKDGMPDWKKISEIDELNDILSSLPPIPPTTE